MNQANTHIFLITFLLLFGFSAVAGDDFDQHRPDGFSDKKWASLKAAVHEAKLLPKPFGNGGENSRFGQSVSVDGNRALVGASNMAGAGAALILEFDGMIWQQVAELLPTDGVSGDSFGISVSLSGDRALVGAYYDDDNGTDSGSAYVFDYDGVSSWSESAKLTAGDGTADDLFGTSVSLSGNRALVGAYGDDDNGTDSGATYVFDYDGISAWSESAKLTAGDSAVNDQFGYSVSLSGDGALVGAYRDDDHGTESGSAYIINLAPQYNVNINVTDLIGDSVSFSNGADTLSMTSDGSQAISTLDDGTAFDVDITVIGLAATNSISFANGGDTTTFTTNTTQTISTLDDGTAFNVSISSAQPDTPNQVCSFTNSNSGNLAGGDYEVTVQCATMQYSVGGTVSGLATGNDVVLQNNGGDDLTVSGDGPFTFATELDDESSYAVTVLTQPTSPNQQCTVAQGAGKLNGADVTDVQVNCVTDVHSIGGTVTGLANNNFVTLSMNSGDEYLVVSSNSSFTFFNSLADGSVYNASVLSNPTTPNQSCTVINGSGTLQGADITDIEVNCTINQYMIGGYVNGLIPDNFMILQNNLSDDLIIQNQGAFAFPAPLDDQQSYDVTIQTQPNDPIQSCAVINGNGSLTGSDVGNIFIICEFGDDLIYRHGFDTPEAISRSLWEPED